MVPRQDSNPRPINRKYDGLVLPMAPPCQTKIALLRVHTLVGKSEINSTLRVINNCHDVSSKALLK